MKTKTCPVCEEYRQYVEYVAQKCANGKPVYLIEETLFAIFTPEDYKKGWRISTEIKFSVRKET
jgi:hypothetical protein